MCILYEPCFQFCFPFVIWILNFPWCIYITSILNFVPVFIIISHCPLSLTPASFNLVPLKLYVVLSVAQPLQLILNKQTIIIRGVPVSQILQPQRTDIPIQTNNICKVSYGYFNGYPNILVQEANIKILLKATSQCPKFYMNIPISQKIWLIPQCPTLN